MCVTYLAIGVSDSKDGSEVDCVGVFSLLHPHKCMSRKHELGKSPSIRS